MNRDRRAAGFEKLGAIGPRSLGLSSSRARVLEIETAWLKAAGPSLARRTRPLGTRRGVLAVEVADPAWRRALERLLPEIEARLSRESPRLGLKGVRLVDGPHG
jgi:predicted nucleic acid-binding Zn ribbon protein